MPAQYYPAPHLPLPLLFTTVGPAHPHDSFGSDIDAPRGPPGRYSWSANHRHWHGVPYNLTGPTASPLIKTTELSRELRSVIGPSVSGPHHKAGSTWSVTQGQKTYAPKRVYPRSVPRPVKLRGVLNPWPEKALFKLKLRASANIELSSVAFGEFILTPSTAFNPLGTSDPIQGHGYDQLNALYGKVIVYGTRIKVTVREDPTSPQDDFMYEYEATTNVYTADNKKVVGFSPRGFKVFTVATPDVGAFTSIPTMESQSNMVGGSGDVTTPVTIKRYLYHPSILGLHPSEYNFRNGYGAAFTASPANLTYFHIMIADISDASITRHFIAEFEMTLYTEMWEPKTVGPSTG